MSASMTKFEGRVVRDVTQFADFVVAAADAADAERQIMELVATPHGDAAFENNEASSYGGWEKHINEGDLNEVDGDTELTFPEGLLELDPETSNHFRLMRVEAVRKAYDAARGEPFDAADRTAASLACILADIRHWCDAHDVDFHRACDLGYEHYIEELAEVRLAQEAAAK